jgi:hypothetical protein
MMSRGDIQDTVAAAMEEGEHGALALEYVKIWISD